MDDDQELVLADLRLRLLFDEEIGERLELDDGEHSPSLIQALGMLRMAEDILLNADVYAEDGDDD